MLYSCRILLPSVRNTVTDWNHTYFEEFLTLISLILLSNYLIMASRWTELVVDGEFELCNTRWLSTQTFKTGEQSKHQFLGVGDSWKIIPEGTAFGENIFGNCWFNVIFGCYSILLDHFRFWIGVKVPFFDKILHLASIPQYCYLLKIAMFKYGYFINVITGVLLF